jgi:aldose 1-epimerase
MLTAKGASVRIFPSAGGRIGSLWLPDRNGRPVEVFRPLPKELGREFWTCKGGIFPLVPYSNRVANSRLVFDGISYHLNRGEADPHALHGNAHRQPWLMARKSESSAELFLQSRPVMDWPWQYTAAMRVDLSLTRLEIEITLNNSGREPMPAGMGLHPFFPHRLSATLQFEAASVWPTDGQLLPLEERPPTADENYSNPRPVPLLSRTLHYGKWGREVVYGLTDSHQVRINADPAFEHLVVHQPLFGDYLCVEPVSHVGNGFNLAAEGWKNTGVKMLRPGDEMRGRVIFELL